MNIKNTKKTVLYTVEDPNYKYKLFYVHFIFFTILKYGIRL